MKGNWEKILPLLVASAALATLAWWWFDGGGAGLKPRVPGTDAAPGGESGGANPVLAGKLIPGPGQPADLPGAWPQFRGPDRDGISPDAAKLSRDWNVSPPREVWALEVGEGYDGVAIRNGRAYLLDYDREAKQSALRCLSLADGKEIWRFAYPLTIKRNHGMTRTVPVGFTQTPDPVGAGFGESLARPGGNATGFTLFEYGILRNDCMYGQVPKEAFYILNFYRG